MDSKLPDDSTPDESPSSGNDQQQTLLMRLDELILSYFDILDVYSELQKHISQDISSGFLSIAQANYSTSSGRRYGQDFYDDRMKALKGVDIVWKEGADFPSFQLKEFSQQDQSVPLDGKSDESGPELRRRKAGRAGCDPLDGGSKSMRSEDTEGPEVGKQTAPVVKQDPRDPIRWFGILVPQPLKEAQMRFSNVLGRLPELVTLLRNLSWHEEEIRMLRKQLGDEILSQELEQVRVSDETDGKSEKKVTEVSGI